jgi:Kef-type K+ transport system membrane component KefB
LSNQDLSILFFLQIAVILAACRLFGWLAKLIGQPQVVGEMAAGIVLGPSLFGLLLPDLHQRLFGPRESKQVLYCLAQLGLALYMFLVGVEFKVGLLWQRGKTAGAVSLSGMIVPFALGAILAYVLFDRLPLFGEHAKRPEAMLFLGAAMCITAFPVLARIISERGIAGTQLGTLALSAGSFDDAAAWCVLAIVLSSFSAAPHIALLTIGGGVLYGLLVLLVVRRLLAPLGQRVEQSGAMSPTMFVFLLLMLMVGAWYTDAIGIHAVFGAFLLGVAMPRGLFAAELERRLEPLVTSFLVPLFFVYSGLNTRMDLVDTWAMWGMAGLVLLVACAGKLAACGVAARLCGEAPRAAFAIGALMNARGMMELIILNIGLERGLITRPLFSVMVIMALVTTLMATPLFNLAYPRGQRPA